MTKAEKFVKEITNIIVSCGGIRLTGVFENSLYPGQCYNVETTGGVLQVTIALKPEEKRPDFLTIFCKFKDPAKAVLALPNDSDAKLNSYSGKWNFHYSKKHDLKDIFHDFGSQLKKIALPEKKEDAETAFERNFNETISLIKRVTTRVRAFKYKSKDETINWGHVGNINLVKEELKAINETINEWEM